MEDLNRFLSNDLEAMTRVERQTYLTNLTFATIKSLVCLGDRHWHLNLKNLRIVLTGINRQARFVLERITIHKSRIAYNDTLGWRGLFDGYWSQVQLLRAEVEIDIAWTVIDQIENEVNLLAQIGGVKITWNIEPVRRPDNEDGGLAMGRSVNGNVID